jgi:hypothetical protein
MASSLLRNCHEMIPVILLIILKKNEIVIGTLLGISKLNYIKEETHEGS